MPTPLQNAAALAFLALESVCDSSLILCHIIVELWGFLTGLQHLDNRYHVVNSVDNTVLVKLDLVSSLQNTAEFNCMIRTRIKSQPSYFAVDSLPDMAG